jgi:hypothetical protein
LEDLQVVAEIAGREEVLAHVFLTTSPKGFAERRVVEDVERPRRTVLDG